ncbi:hypothetical protein M8756_16130 [Lutimaribacter sp. EGI FJ00015]|uniref:Uncharacterized protein n=1 Tax=Lutimaribacter degradans TaxID=2945989 RepID=A0ACC5ZZ41_9RHOB|nr:hypothetical protein [Lutimaribacter sp. EGI FJ00013]MCM2563617.1 hypothetical protein [Lutimaribacter sp. EGI FJ00013]MCO0614847.1 hypothetical protein [Lutimaribacter sp. EGI FJ00015]MCO0637469.1 hypothetical protein [Lutimaribacter sp. EGI FJ00014]
MKKPGITALAIAFTAIVCPALAWSETGLTYHLHEADVAAENFDDTPPDHDGAIVRYVEQGPEFTAIWSVRNGDIDPDPAKATFASGERRMGLFIPFRDAGKQAAEAEGWKSFGRDLHYDRFEVSFSRGDKDRSVAGIEAVHYEIGTEIVFRMGDNPNGTRHHLESDVWLLPDHPYSEAPFAVDRAYADPRLAAALEEELGKIGMVGRVHTSYGQQPVDPSGSLVGDERSGTHMAWVTDLSAGEIQDIAPPVVAPETFDALRKASRAQPEKDCATILEGGTPGFIKDGLAPAAHAAFLSGLTPSCKRAFPDLASE